MKKANAADFRDSPCGGASDPAPAQSADAPLFCETCDCTCDRFADAALRGEAVSVGYGDRVIIEPMDVAVPAGEITSIIGPNGCGKSTLLKALELGVYNHIAGDGREYVITDASAFKLRAEEGRSIHGVDISTFISNLPTRADTANFSTENASGSTSQAANTVEALSVGSKVLLIDEDTSATNFMVRDMRMAQLVPDVKEPISPFIRKIRSLHRDLGISTVLVAGSSGDYLSVADTVLQMDCYHALLIFPKIIPRLYDTRHIQKRSKNTRLPQEAVPALCKSSPVRLLCDPDTSILSPPCKASRKIFLNHNLLSEQLILRQIGNTEPALSETAAHPIAPVQAISHFQPLFCPHSTYPPGSIVSCAYAYSFRTLVCNRSRNFACSVIL